MKLIVFSKMFKSLNVEQLAEVALQLGIDGFELCLRPGYPINPDNVREKLAQAARYFSSHRLSIPMISGTGDLLSIRHPAAESILNAMDEADIRMLKLGYFKFNPETQSYWQEVDRIRGEFDLWEKAAQKYQVKIVYHTHSGGFMGGNAAALSHILRGFDPRFIGAYLDPAHLVVEGEEFALGLSMLKEYITAVGLKDVDIVRKEADGHGEKQAVFGPAGTGMVNWIHVFHELKRMNFAGPLSIHCQYAGKGDAIPVLQHEVQYFRAYVMGEKEGFI